VHRFMTIERFKLVFVAYIIFASVKTVVLAAHTTPLRGLHFALAGVEIAAAIGLLITRASRLAAAALLCVFMIAALLELSFGEVPAQLLLYAAITLLLLGAARSEAS
jgi:hypothetical protein